jgi:excinuclease ABC subunit C
VSPRRPKGRGTTEAIEARVAALHAQVKADAERRPGTYRFIAESGEVLYVGKAKALRPRLLSYFRAEYPGEKAARLVREAAHVEWTYEPSEFAACLSELRQIKRLRPRANVMMKRDARHYCFITVTRGRAPRLLVVRGAGSVDGALYYGPFLGATRVREAVRELSDALGLRDCTLDHRMRFADQRELWPEAARTPGCLRFEIGRCLGPCVAAPEEREYAAQVAVARAFLDGTDDAPLATLVGRMAAASDALDFEKAAFWRDKLKRLEGLRAQFDRLRFAVEQLSFAYHVPGHDGDDRTYLVRRGRVRRELAAPTPGELAAAMAAEFAGGPRDGGAIPTHEVDELLLLTSWFANRPDELARTTPPPAGRVPVAAGA